jgi:hypothetical protein
MIEVQLLGGMPAYVTDPSRLPLWQESVVRVDSDDAPTAQPPGVQAVVRVPLLARHSVASKGAAAPASSRVDVEQCDEGADNDDVQDHTDNGDGVAGIASTRRRVARQRRQYMDQDG